MMPMSTSHPRGDRLDRLSQRTRRIVAVATLTGLPAMYAWSSFWLGTSVPNVIWGPISFVLIGLTAVGAIILYRFVRDRADLGARTLDERQRQLRDRAWALSYGVLAIAVVIAVAVPALLVLGMGRQVTLDPNLMTALAICAGTLIPVLPVAALAWLEPDLPADA
jgi:hypothetical protein